MTYDFLVKTQAEIDERCMLLNVSYYRVCKDIKKAANFIQDIFTRCNPRLRTVAIVLDKLGCSKYTIRVTKGNISRTVFHATELNSVFLELLAQAVVSSGISPLKHCDAIGKSQKHWYELTAHRNPSLKTIHAWLEHLGIEYTIEYTFKGDKYES
jgi:hypothetical protein